MVYGKTCALRAFLSAYFARTVQASIYLNDAIISQSVSSLKIAESFTVTALTFASAAVQSVAGNFINWVFNFCAAITTKQPHMYAFITRTSRLLAHEMKRGQVPPFTAGDVLVKVSCSNLRHGPTLRRKPPTCKSRGLGMQKPCLGAYWLSAPGLTNTVRQSTTDAAQRNHNAMSDA